MDMDVDLCSSLYEPWNSDESEADEDMEYEEDSDPRMAAGADDLKDTKQDRSSLLLKKTT